MQVQWIYCYCIEVTLKQVVWISIISQREITAQFIFFNIWAHSYFMLWMKSSGYYNEQKFPFFNLPTSQTLNVLKFYLDSSVLQMLTSIIFQFTKVFWDTHNYDILSQSFHVYLPMCIKQSYWIKVLDHIHMTKWNTSSITATDCLFTVLLRH